MTERVRRSREGSSSNNNNRYSIDMLLPGLRATDEEEKKGDDEEGRKDGKEEGGRSRLENVLIMSEKRSGGGKEEMNRMPSGSSNRKDGGECNDNGAYLSTPPASATPLLHHQLTGSSNGREDQQEQQQQQQPSPRRKVSGIITTTTTTTTAATTTNVGPKKRSAASPLKPTTQPKHMLLSAAASVTAGGTTGGVSKMSKKNMLEAFQPWVLQAYGDSAKTKTITKKKYYRIVKTLRGEEINNAENSKFRFWVKAKGFHIGVPPGHSNPKDERTSCSFSNEPDLFVPTTVKDASSEEKSVYKRVAVVEHFFDIIYTVHVETEAKNGKHAGQKRTYRAITEKYAFLPREAVTKFLLQCMECQKRGSPAGDLLPVNGKAPQEDPVSVEPSTNSTSGRGGRKQQLSKCGRKAGGGRRRGTLDINFSLPFTTTYLRQQQLVKEKEKAEEDEEMEEEVREKGLEDYDDEDAHLSDATPMDEDHELGAKTRNGDGKGEGNGDIGAGPVEWLGYHAIGLKKEPPPPPPPPAPTTNNNIYSNGKHDFREQSSPLSLSDRSGVNNHGEAGQDETSSNGNKDDEDDDDDESEDKIDTQQHDPERLKAFNMFVRLFVDENLDRMVPISKQPKEKIQAIIDSCTRQFPEFAERARKRIRTYLKSCRRNKRSRDTNGWESSRPTPAHLTSVQAEQILAQACENESQNAKRMRMGLEPVGQPLPLPLQQQQQQNDRNNSNSSSDVLENGHHHSRSGSTSTRDRSSRVSDENAGEQRNNNGRMASPAEAERNSKSSSSSTSSSCGSNSSAPIGISNVAASSSPVTDMMTQQSAPTSQSSSHPPTSTGGRPVVASACENQYPSGGIQAAPKAHERSSAVDYSRALNGSSVANMSIFRPNIGQAFPRPAPFTALFPPGAAASAVTAAAATAAGLANFTPHPAASPLPIPSNDTGPTDLSMKAKPLLTHKLNSSEIATVRQLITGYRESAAFLLRSADELEQLLIQQQ